MKHGGSLARWWDIPPCKVSTCLLLLPRLRASSFPRYHASMTAGVERQEGRTILLLIPQCINFALTNTFKKCGGRLGLWGTLQIPIGLIKQVTKSHTLVTNNFSGKPYTVDHRSSSSSMAMSQRTWWSRSAYSRILIFDK